MEVNNSENSSIMDKTYKNAPPLAEETSAHSTECKLAFFSSQVVVK